MGEFASFKSTSGCSSIKNVTLKLAICANGGKSTVFFPQFRRFKGFSFTRGKFIKFEILNTLGQSGTILEYWDKLMSASKVQPPVNLYLGAIVALICAVMVALNVTGETYFMAAVLMVVLLVLLADLIALMRGRQLPVRIELVLALVGIAIIVAICQIGIEAAFYAFPAVVGAFLVRTGAFHWSFPACL